MFQEPISLERQSCQGDVSRVQEFKCPMDVCVDRCNTFQWGPWSECCGHKIGDLLEISRSRIVPETDFHPELCPREEKMSCQVQIECPDLESKSDIYYLLKIFVFIENAQSIKSL